MTQQELFYWAIIVGKYGIKEEQLNYPKKKIIIKKMIKLPDNFWEDYKWCIKKLNMVIIEVFDCLFNALYQERRYLQTY